MKIFQAFVLGTFFVIVGAIVALFALGLRPGAGRMTSAIVIAGPPEAVWPWITEPARLARWVRGLAEVRQDTLTAGGAGSRQTWFLAEPGTRERMAVSVTVTEQDAPRLRRTHLRTPGVFEGEYAYVLVPVAGGTRLEQTESLRYDVWFARLLEPLVTPQARRRLAADQARLQALAEAGPAAADSAGAAPAVAAPAR